MGRRKSHENRMVPYNHPTNVPVNPPTNASYQPYPYLQPPQPYPAYPAYPANTFPYHLPHHGPQVHNPMPYSNPYPPQMHSVSYPQNPQPYFMPNSQFLPMQNPTCPPQALPMGNQQPSHFQMSLSHTVINMYQVQTSNQPQTFHHPSTSYGNPSITNPLQPFPSSSQGSHLNPMLPQSQPFASACSSNPSNSMTASPLQPFTPSSLGNHINPMPPQSQPLPLHGNPKTNIPSEMQPFHSNSQGHPMKRMSPQPQPFPSSAKTESTHISTHQPSPNAEDQVDDIEVMMLQIFIALDMCLECCGLCIFML